MAQSTYMRNYLLPERDKGRQLLELIMDVVEERILYPHFQRKFVWPDEKVKDWCEYIQEKVQGVGVIVTYQLDTDPTKISPVYLSDGRQRLGASIQILENPEKFGIHPNDVHEILRTFEITVQHRIYHTHADAHREFQRLNKGESITPAEFHKGYLTSTPKGEMVYNRCMDIMDRHPKARLMSENRKISRGALSNLIRDSLGLFYQLATKFKGTDYWRVSHKKISTNSKQIEGMLADFIETKSTETLNTLLDNFERTILDAIALIEDSLIKTHGTGKRISPAMLRNLLHLYIWIKNTRFNTIQWYVDYLKIIFRNGNLNATVYLPLNERGHTEHVTVHMDNLTRVFAICDAYGHSYNANHRKQKNNNNAPGYDECHVLPWSTEGEGETFTAPSSLNRSIGAMPMFPDDYEIDDEDEEDEE